MSKHHNQPASQNNDQLWYKILIGISFLIFPLILPPIFKDGIPSGHDVMIHLVYIRSFTDALSSGQFPVRWIEWVVPGLNHPLFNFYQPMFYYLFQIPHFLGFSYTASLKLLLASLWLLSGLFMFLFTRLFLQSTTQQKSVPVLGGILAAIFYMFAPYHIVDIFVRAAYPEFTALAFVPAIFWGIQGFSTTKRGLYLFITTISTALVITSHPPTMLMFSPLILGYILYRSFISNFSSLIFHLSSLALGFGISSFFLLPSLLEQEYIQAVFLRNGYYDFKIHFACLPQLFVPNWDYGISQQGCIDTMSFQLGIAHWFVLIGTILLITRNYIKRQFTVYNTVFLLFAGIGIVSMYMTLVFSQSIWESAPLLSYLQYPWRFLAVGIFTTSFIAALALLFFQKLTHQYLAYAGLLILITATSYGYLHPAVYIPEKQTSFDAANFTEGKDIDKPGFSPELGYMPIWANVHPPKDALSQNGVKILKGQTTVIVKNNTPTYKSYTLTAKEPTEIGFLVHYFPGWKLLINNKEQQFGFDKKQFTNSMFGYIQTTITPGEHTVILHFENTPIRSFANIATIISLLASFLFIFFKKSS